MITPFRKAGEKPGQLPHCKLASLNFSCFRFSSASAVS